MPLDFPEWASNFRQQLRRLQSGDPDCSAPLLHPFQRLFERWFPHHLLGQQDEGPHSRTRAWPLRLTFWTFLWQVAQAGASCREAVRQAANLCRVSGHRLPSVEDSPYCQARAALPLERLDQLHRVLVKEARQAVVAKDLWCGHPVYAVDGTTVTLPDTPPNQERYLQQSCQRPGCGFPILRLTGLFSLATGLFASWATGPYREHELQQLNRLWPELDPGDIVLGDRGFCTYGVVAQALARGLHVVLRARGTHRSDFRRGKRLSRDERLVTWRKPTRRPRTIPEDLVPDRPGRREPRAVKRRPKPYPRLTCHRRRFQEIRHQNRYYIPSRRRAARNNARA
jgi:hypothetical protein